LFKHLIHLLFFSIAHGLIPKAQLISFVGIEMLINQITTFNLRLVNDAHDADVTGIKL